MGDSRTRKFDEVASTINEESGDENAIKSAPSESRTFSDWSLIRRLNGVARGIRDAVNCSLDAARGRYDR